VKGHIEGSGHTENRGCRGNGNSTAIKQEGAAALIQKRGGKRENTLASLSPRGAEYLAVGEGKKRVNEHSASKIIPGWTGGEGGEKVGNSGGPVHAKWGEGRSGRKTWSGAGAQNVTSWERTAHKDSLGSRQKKKKSGKVRRAVSQKTGLGLTSVPPSLGRRPRNRKRPRRGPLPLPRRRGGGRA